MKPLNQSKPNVIFVFADQWRYQATGFAGDPNVQTPNLDKLAASSLNFTNAISGMPVCCPARSSLLMGQYPGRHGVFMNDVSVHDNRTIGSNQGGPNQGTVSLAEAFADAGYDTAYVGKWHVDGHGRSNYIPRKRRLGFDFWMALECTHNYNDSRYYAGDDDTQLVWNGYDAECQTRVVQQYIREHSQGNPYLMLLSWGPPHAPYDTAPERYQAMFNPDELTLHPNVPPEAEEKARRDLAGYYAHIVALDDLLGELLQTIEESGQADNTLFVFWSDHGDMLGSHGNIKKQQPWEESLHVPLLMRCPALFGEEGQTVDGIINTPDLMPTLLGLCDIDVPASVQGIDYAPYLQGSTTAPADAVLISCFQPFGQWSRAVGGREYRGVRTERYTYARGLDGPWLLYDNQTDPYQLENRINEPAMGDVQAMLDTKLNELLATYDDELLPGEVYLERWGYEVDETGTVPYTW
ncbi:MAG: sulfatase [Chloroflexota bacterium]